MYGMLYAVFMWVSPYLDIGCGGGGGSPKALVHNLLMQFYTLGSSKSKFPKFILIL